MKIIILLVESLLFALLISIQSRVHISTHKQKAKPEKEGCQLHPQIKESHFIQLVFIELLL